MTIKIQQRLNQIAWISVVYIVFVILWGAVVRATGSGAGCGSHWPLCNGEVIPIAKTIATSIEFFHRFTSGLSLMLVLALWIGCLKFLKRPHRARMYSSISLFLIICEALIGAGLVIFGLVAKDDSAGRVWVISFHLINTLLLVASLTLTASSLKSNVSQDSKLRFDGASFGITVLFLLIAATGAICALGDTLFPSTSIAHGIAQDLDTSSHWIIRLRAIHPVLAVLFAFLGFAYALKIESKTSKAFQHTILLQITLGVINWLTLAPVGIQILHLAVSNTLWVLWIQLQFRPTLTRFSNR
ncbi:MAG: COX15/CtaA family protein [Xanthomonadaceae bacterium]|nr:COX15/CtaA family protein [Xanthomonadaceae bacterium]